MVNEGTPLLPEGRREAKEENELQSQYPLWGLVKLLSTASAYGCILSTLFLLTLPIECQRMVPTERSAAVALSLFVTVAGLTQLVGPIVGHVSDALTAQYQNVRSYPRQRLPYYLCGSLLASLGLTLQGCASAEILTPFPLASRMGQAFYLLGFLAHMIGLNIQYALMLALLADQVPSAQRGRANGILALLLLTGSLIGLGIFQWLHTLTQMDRVYGLYFCMIAGSAALTTSQAYKEDWLTNEEETWGGLRARLWKPVRELFEDGGATLWRTFLLSIDDDNDNDNEGRNERDGQNGNGQKDDIVARNLERQELRDSLHDFSCITLSRLFYYCGSSVQTFFLYFLQDRIDTTAKDEQALVATLAMLGQLGGAFVCYPVGWWADKNPHRQRAGVWVACALFAMGTATLTTVTTVLELRNVCVGLGVANGMYLTLETKLAVDALPPARTAKWLGIWGIAAFLGSALGPMVGGPVLFLTSPSSTDDGSIVHYSSTGYTIIWTLASCYFLISAVALCFLRKV